MKSDEHYNYFRDYDPALGRYFESDPTGLDAGPNTFSYVSASPITFSDPEGLCTIDVRFKPVPIFGNFKQYHAYIVTTDPSGRKMYFRGGPSGAPRNGSVFGTIETSFGEYWPGTKDFGVGPSPSIRVRDDDGDCGCVNMGFSDIFAKIGRKDIPYNPLNRNSNSAVGTALRSSGYSVNRTPVSAPGFNKNLAF